MNLSFVLCSHSFVVFFGLRFAVLVDSLVVLGIAAKGRSSSHRLNPVLRRLNAHVLASGFYVFFGYVVSRQPR